MERWRAGGPNLGPETAEVLRARLGDPHWVRRLPSSPRSQVWLAEFNGAPAVVKQISSTGSGTHDADARFVREVTALRLAARVHPPVVPAVLATLPGPRLLVLERLSNGRRPQTNWVRPWAVALARLHASTGPADTDSLPPWSGPLPDDVEDFLALAEHLQVPVPSQVPAELEQLLERLHRAGGHDLLHGDPCPGNDLYLDGVARFVDLESASLGHGLVELAYLRIGFPTCWCVTAIEPAQVIAAEAGYRRTYRAITGDEPGGDLTDCCVGWLIRGDALVERDRRGTAGHPCGHLAAVGRRDWRWGTATARQRLAHRLTVVAQLCATRADLVGTGWLCTALRARIAVRWSAPAALPRRRPD